MLLGRLSVPFGRLQLRRHRLESPLSVTLSCLRRRRGSAQAEGLLGRNFRQRAQWHLPPSIPFEATFRGPDRPRVEAIAYIGELQAFHLSKWEAFAAS